MLGGLVGGEVLIFELFIFIFYFFYFSKITFSNLYITKSIGECLEIYSTSTNTHFEFLTKFIKKIIKPISALYFAELLGAYHPKHT
jgi:hypothetical protein